MLEPDKLFSQFLTKGIQVEYDKRVDFFIYKLSKTDCSCSDYEILREHLKEFNSSSNLIVKDDNLQLEFENSTQAWGNNLNSYLYKDINSFIRACLDRRAVPEKFCLLDKKITNHDTNNVIINKVLSLTRWTKLLEDMADHCPDNNVLVFFVHQEASKSKVYEISPFVEFEELETLKIDCDQSRFEHLKDSWHLKDAHEKDRKSVMLVSFSEIMSQLSGSENPFRLFLVNTQKFHDRYRENYDIYVNRFSVDSQLREIDEQHLDFIGKLQDLVTSAQTKAFAIPGVMIAMGALAKITNWLSVLAILTGVIMIKLIITRSNDLIRENLNHFEKTCERALGQYVRSRNEAEEVRVHAEDASSKLIAQISKAHERVNFIDTLAECMVIIGFIIIIGVMFMIKAGVN